MIMTDIQTTDKRVSTLKKILIGLGIVAVVSGGLVLIQDEQNNICLNNLSEQTKTNLAVKGSCLTQREFDQLKVLVIQKVKAKDWEAFETEQCNDKSKCEYRISKFLSLFLEISDRELKEKNKCEAFIFKNADINEIIDNVNVMLENPPKPKNINIDGKEIKNACFNF